MARVTRTSRLPQHRKAMEDQVFAALYAAGDLVRVDMAHSITEGSISGKGHVPSHPGEPPNADTRQLNTSIVTVGVRERMAVQVRVGAPHGLPLELGTPTVAPRPFARPALRRNKKAVADTIAKALKRATGG